MNAKGVYYGLVEAQNLRLKNEKETELENDEIESINFDERYRWLNVTKKNISFSNNWFEKNKIT